MKRQLIILSLALCGALLSACSRSGPVVENGPLETPTLEATSSLPGMGTASSLPGMGTMSPLGVPTTAPTANATPKPVQTYTVKRGTIDDSMSFSGQIAPIQAQIAFDRSGIVGTVYVKPGQSIKKGTLVAELEMRELAAQLREARMNYQQSQNALNQAAQAGQLQVKQAELDLEAARQALQQAKVPATPVAIAEAQTAVRAAQANLDTVRNNASQAKNIAYTNMNQAVQNLQTIQKDYGENVNLLEQTKSASERERITTRIHELETQMHAAEAAVAQAVINYDTARNNEVAAVKDAEAQLDLTKARLDALLRGPDPFQIATQEREVRRAELAVKQARVAAAPAPALTLALETSRLRIQELERTSSQNQLFAPYGGEVASIDAAAGTSVQVGTPVVTLIDRSQIEIVADSTNIESGSRKTTPQLKPGQPVAISFSRYPGQVLTGTIRLAPNAQVAGTTDTRYHIAFEPQRLSLDPGDLANLQVNLGRKYDALWLPPAAVKTSGTRTTVTLRAAGVDKKVEVFTGLITLDKVEIVSGLAEGDVVIVE